MISPSFSLTATERVLPRLALDFTTANLDSRITFSRALNTATRTNSSGYIETVNANTPRFDYDSVTLACKGLLIEELRTNYFYDNYFQNAFGTSLVNNTWWLLTNMSSVNNATTSPDGTNNAALVSVTSSTSFRALQYVSTVASAGTYTASIYVKPKGSDNKVTLRLANSSSYANRIACEFTLSSSGSVGTVTTSGTGVTSSDSPTITLVKNGWYRITISATMSSATNVSFVLYPGTASAQTTNSETYVWGAQLESGSFATSVIPTTSGTATRNADVATMTGTNFSDWYSNDAGTFMCQAIPYVQSYTITRQMMTVDSNPPLYVNQNSTVVRTFDGTTVISATGQIQANTAFKCAVSYDTNGRSVSKDASTPVTGTYDGSFGTTAFNIGSNGSAFFWNGYIQRINWYQQKLTNAEVQAITK